MDFLLEALDRSGIGLGFGLEQFPAANTFQKYPKFGLVLERVDPPDLDTRRLFRLIEAQQIVDRPAVLPLSVGLDVRLQIQAGEINFALAQAVQHAARPDVQRIDTAGGQIPFQRSLGAKGHELNKDHQARREDDAHRHHRADGPAPPGELHRSRGAARRGCLLALLYRHRRDSSTFTDINNRKTVEVTKNKTLFRLIAPCTNSEN